MVIARKKKEFWQANKNKENILTLISLKMLILKIHRGGVCCISLKACNGQGHVPPPLLPGNAENLGRAWKPSWELPCRVSLTRTDAWPAGSRSSLFSQPFCSASELTPFALGWPGPAAPPAAAAAPQLVLLLLAAWQGRNSTPLLPPTQRASTAPKWRSGFVLKSISC